MTDHTTFIDLLNNNFGTITTCVLAIISCVTVYYTVRPAILKYENIKQRRKEKLISLKGKIITKLYNPVHALTPEQILELIIFLPDKSIKKIKIKDQAWLSEALLEVRKEMLGKTKVSVEDINEFIVRK